MDSSIQIMVAGMVNRYPDGTKVKLYGVDGVPDGTVGVVDFVDDTGRVFVETPKGCKNGVLTHRDEGTRLIKICA